MKKKKETLVEKVLYTNFHKNKRYFSTTYKKEANKDLNRWFENNRSFYISLITFVCENLHEYESKQIWWRRSSIFLYGLLISTSYVWWVKVYYDT